MTSETEKTIGKAFWIKLVMIPVLMFGFAFALVPLYDVFCDVTGLNGRTKNQSYEGLMNSNIDMTHKVNISFLSAIAPGFPVEFHPETRQMDIIPGKVYTMNYFAENRSDQTIIGQAIPSVAPSEASIHFKKLECFCFTNQKFEPKTPVELPVRFFVDTKLDSAVQDITLSYNFFKVNKPDDPVAGL